MLEVRDATIRFGGTAAVDGMSVTVADGEVLALLGPSGSGKTTLLRAVAGLQPLDAGAVRWDGEDLAPMPAHRRGFGLVFQDFALFPHLDVGRNVEFGLRMQGVEPAERHRRAAGALEQVELAGMERRRVTTLSGGQQQRVALARALAAGPRMLLLDEPLGSLDRALRERLTGDLRRVLARPGITALYVTHDQAEAFAVADRVAVVDRGAVVQQGTPQEVWRRPADEFVAGFLGFRTITDAVVAAGVADAGPFGSIPVPGTPDGPARLVIRPDALRLDPAGALEARVRAVTFQGSFSRLDVEVDGAAAVAHTRTPPEPGTTVRLRLDPDEVVALPAG